jgi:hypothetical protein
MLLRCCYKVKDVSKILREAKVADYIRSMTFYALDAYFSNANL